MANVRLLRQSIQDYQEDYEKAYDQYSNEFNAERAKEAANVKAYNDAIAAAEASKTPLAVDTGSGYKLIGTGGDGRLVPLVPDLKRNRGDFVFTRLPDGRLQLNRYDGGGGWGGGGYAPVELPIASLEKLPPVVMPKEPGEGKVPNITASNARELMNPGQNQANLALQAAKGILGKSELTGDQQPAMRGSAFADPQGLKERGVLARVMSGQL